MNVSKMGTTTPNGVAMKRLTTTFYPFITGSVSRIVDENPKKISMISKAV